MPWRWISLLMFVPALACGGYQPNIAEGLACSTDGECPKGQSCFDRVCWSEAPDTPDGGVGGEGDESDGGGEPTIGDGGPDIGDPPPASNAFLVWGGFDGNTLDNGAIYLANSDEWITPAGLTGTPLGTRNDHAAVWTGEEVLIWGGKSGLDYFDSGALYNPATDTWRQPPGLNSGPLDPRVNHVAVWTGESLIVWGGYLSGTGDLNDGAVYDLASDSWRSPPGLNSPPLTERRGANGVWTGSHLLVWGGTQYDNGNWPKYRDGAMYSLDDDAWIQPDKLKDAPQARYLGTAVWDGTRAWFSGDSTTSELMNYDIRDDSWAVISASNAPSARSYPGMALLSQGIFVWGGNNVGTRYRDGAVFDPDTDKWSQPAGFIADAPGERNGHSVTAIIYE